MIRTLPRLLIILSIFYAVAAQADHSAMVQDAWIADAPPIAKIRAAYLMIHNGGAHTVAIRSFSSPDFERIELHRTVVEGDMVKMEEIKTLEIKAGEHIEFKPGGYHLMLFNPKRKLKIGDTVNLLMTLKDGQTTQFTAKVRERGEGKHMKMKCGTGKCGGGKCGGK